MSHNVFNTSKGLFVFGDNGCGQLGLGDRIDRDKPTKLEFFEASEIISISCGCSHTIIHTIDGLFVFGGNYNGQLGLGDNRYDILEPRKLEFLKDLEIKSIHCGSHYTIINTIDGLFVFGSNSDGQLGLGDTKNRYEPTKLEFFNDLEIISIHCGSHCTIINTIDGLFVFGSNHCGQLGAHDMKDQILIPKKLEFKHETISIHCGGHHTIINTTDGLFVFGDNYYGQLGLGDHEPRLKPTKLEFLRNEASEIISIHCGRHYTIIRVTDGLFVFGENTYSQLGLGDHEHRYEPTKLEFKHEIISIHCNAHHTIIYTIDGLFAFGSNCSGQLGLVNEEYTCEPTKLKFEHEIILSNNKKQIKSALSYSVLK